MTRHVRIAIDENLEGSVVFSAGDEHEIDSILGSVGLNASGPRKHPRSSSLRVMTIESVTVKPLNRTLLRERFEANGFEIHDETTL